MYTLLLINSELAIMFISLIQIQLFYCTDAWLLWWGSLWHSSSPRPPHSFPYSLSPLLYESHLRQICRVVVARGGFICVLLLPGNGIQCSGVQFEIMSTIAGPKVRVRQRFKSIRVRKFLMSPGFLHGFCNLLSNLSSSIKPAPACQPSSFLLGVVEPCRRLLIMF